jgi:hypothetical protein
MLRALLIALTLTCCSSLARADLRFPAPSVDLGDIRAGVPLSHAFSFTNTGPHTVSVTQLQPGCGCLRPHLEQHDFAPGAQGTIPLEVHTLGQAAGPHRWYLTVIYSDAATQHAQKLEVVGNVITEVSVQPAALTLFTGGTLVHEVTLTDLRAQPLNIERVLTTSPNLRAQAAPFVKDAFDHWTSRIRIEIGDQPTAQGPQAETLTIYTNDPLYRELRVAVTLIQRSSQRVVATPAEVTLSRGPRLVRLRDAQDQAVVIESATADDPAIVCSWAAGPENQATLQLQPDRAKLRDDPIHATVRVQLSQPLREVVTIPVVIAND